jgi:signal transduction histidine kinase
VVQICFVKLVNIPQCKAASIRILQEANQITLEIRDRGKGMSLVRLTEIQSGRSGVGISGMRERLRQFEER